jgi:nucleotide-binding universal stress UspA family protein
LLHEFVKRHLSPSVQEVVIKETIEMGEPDDLIVDWANDNSIDVIVISTHGRSGLSRMILGSVTEKVLRKARCPVLAVPCHEA